MTHSIKAKLALVFSIMMILILAFSIGVNTIFLGKYYQNTKETALKNVYSRLVRIAVEDSDFSESTNIYTLNADCERQGVTLLVLNSDGSYQYAYGADEMLRERILTMLLGLNDMDKTTVISSTDSYVLQTVEDGMSGQKYMEMFGKLSSDSYFIIRIAFESINESVAISNQFFAYVSGVLLILSIFIIIFIVNSYTRPILQLANLSKKMSDLDFEAKYEGKRRDEIGVLGNSMNELSNKLEQNISELKAANIELQRDIDKKTEVDNMRTEFISNVSHELKTPIALIQGYAEGLKEAVNDDPESRDFYCEVIMDEAIKMNRMVRNLLELNQIEFGNSHINIERFDITEVIEGVLRSTKLLIEQSEITVEFDNSNPVYVWADEFQTEEVITNYISNAIHYCKYEKIVRINIEHMNDNVRVSVFNTGDNIPEDELENVWIKFYKVDKARTREYGGNGIGLSIVKAVMESMNKECGVNNVEEGVVFWFDLDSNTGSVKGNANDSDN